MKILLYTNMVPTKEHSTVTYMMWLLTNKFLEIGYEVSFLIPCREGSRTTDPEFQRHQQEVWSKVGVEIVYFALSHENLLDSEEEYFRSTRFRSKLRNPAYYKFLLRRLYSRDPSRYFPEIRFRDQLKIQVDTIDPDVIVSFADYGDTFALARAAQCRCLFILGDLPTESYRMQTALQFAESQATFKAFQWRRRSYVAGLERALLKLMRGEMRWYLTSHHYADWALSKGVQAEYIRNIVPDWRRETSLQDTSQSENERPFTIVMMGHMTGTATLSGLYHFAYDVLPNLGSMLPDGFEIRICGKGTVPADLGEKLSHPNVKMLGFVEDIISELEAADVFLVPTPLPLGIRVRIPYVWSLEICVVAHGANKFGLSELVHDENALLGNNGEEIASLLACVASNTALRKKIAIGGRKTYDQFYSPSVRIPEFLNLVTEINNDETLIKGA